MSVKRRNFVKSIESLLNQTREFETLRVMYGMEEVTEVDGFIAGENVVHDKEKDIYWMQKFVECEEDINLNPLAREVVLVKWGNQSNCFGIMQSIEGDSLSSVMFDVMNAIRKIR